ARALRAAASPAHRRNVGLDRAAVGRPRVPAGLPALPRPPLLDAGVRGADRDLGGARVRDGSIESVMSTPEAGKHEILNEGPDELVMLWLGSPPGLEDFFRAIGRPPTRALGMHERRASLGSPGRSLKSDPP